MTDERVELFRQQERIAKLEAENERLWEMVDAQIEIEAENERLRKSILSSRRYVNSGEQAKDAERWREIMLEWGDGVVNGFGDFWDRVGVKMTNTEQRAAIDSAMEGE